MEIHDRPHMHDLLPQEGSSTEGSQEKRDFDGLTPSEKVFAVLAVARQPISQELALNFAGLNPVELDPETLEGIRTIFTSNKVEHIEQEEGNTRYQLTEEAKENLSKGIDLATAETQVENVLLEIAKKEYGL